MSDEDILYTVESLLQALGRWLHHYALTAHNSHELGDLDLDGEDMLFVSSEGPISLENISIRGQSFLVVGEMAPDTITKLAELFGVEFAGGHGVFKLEKDPK